MTIKTLRATFFLACLSLGVTLIAIALAPQWVVMAQDTTSSRPITGDNGYCLVCHNQPWKSVTLSDGSILNLYVDETIIASSVHGTRHPEGTFGCIDCHGERSFPHIEQTPLDARSFALDAVAMCTECHAEQATLQEQGLHAQAIADGNHEAAVCTDCHGAHDAQPSENHPQLVAGICGDCHQDTLIEWRRSPHVSIGPLGCATCHSPHSQLLRAGDVGDSDAMCITCHNDTNMPNSFIHSQHLASPTYDIACADCHMTSYDSTALVSNTISLGGHTMALDSTPCITCHEELESNGTWSERPSSATVETTLANTASPTPAADALNALVLLIQGLILGLGLGITFAIVFIPRMTRSS